MFCLLCTALATVAGNENLFGKLKLVKNYLITTQGNSCLSDLLLLYSEKNIVDDIKLKNIVKQFKLKEEFVFNNFLYPLHNVFVNIFTKKYFYCCIFYNFNINIKVILYLKV